MKLSTLCYEEILGFEPSNVTAYINTLHKIIRILETSNENPEHSILKLKESNLHHYLLDTIIFFIMIKIFHVKPLIMLSKLVVDVAVLEVLTNAFVTYNSWPTSHASTQHAAPLPALKTQTRWGVCVRGVLREEIGQGGEYVTARREWTKLDRNVPNLVSFCTKEENTNFFTQPLVLHHQHCGQAKSCKARATFLDSFWGSDWGWHGVLKFCWD